MPRFFFRMAQDCLANTVFVCYTDGMQIGKVDFGRGLCLAPMAGVSDFGFRSLCVQFGANATWSEMLSARAMLHNPKKTTYMTQLAENEHLPVGQIFGHEPERMVAALQLPFLQAYSCIDINMGCPAPKIVKNGEGSALMRDPALASRIISACVRATEKPVLVKFRLGIDRDVSTAFGRMCAESGAAAVTLHARTAQMGYSGRADYEAIARLKATLQIPVIGNGDVVDEQSYRRMLETGVDGVMIGRGAMGRPWLFTQLQGRSFAGSRFAVVARHVALLRQVYPERYLTLYLRKHFLWYTAFLSGASELRARLATSDSIDESLKILQEVLK